MASSITDLSDQELLALDSQKSAGNIKDLSDEELLSMQRHSDGQKFNTSEHLGNILKNLPNEASSFIKGSVESPLRGLQGVANRLAKNLNPTGQYLNDLDIVPQSRNVDKNSYELGEQTSDLASLLSPGIGATRAIGRGIGKGVDVLRPTNIFAGNLSPEQLAENLHIAKGTNTSLGNIINNPFLKRMYENYLVKTPITGASETLEQTGNQVIDRGTHIMDQLKGSHSAENVEKQLHQTVQQGEEASRAVKNNLYSHADKIADNIGLKLELPEFASTAREHVASIEDMKLLKNDPKIRSVLSKIKGYTEPVQKETKEGLLVDKSGKPLLSEEKVSYPSLKEANLLKSSLDRVAADYRSGGTVEGRYNAKILGELSSVLKKDINRAIDKSEHPELKEAYRNAENYYAKNYSKYLDKDIYKFTLKGPNEADSDLLISEFIKTDKATDRANMVKKLSSVLPENKRNLLGYGYLSRALNEKGVIDPLKMKTLLSKNSLGERQFKELFPNSELQNQLRNFSKLTSMNEKGLNIMVNPMTGAQLSDYMPFSGRIGTLLPRWLGGRAATRFLTSEPKREEFVRKIIENKTKNR